MGLAGVFNVSAAPLPGTFAAIARIGQDPRSRLKR
jgi:hypothetical protein